jgi:hypothetical protein
MRPLPILAVFLATALAGIGAVSLALEEGRLPPAAFDHYAYVMERKLAAQVARGNAVILEGNVSEPALRWKIAERIGSAPELAVFGSSHSLRIGAEALGRPSVLNFSVSGAALVDHLVISEILESRGLRPANHLVFLDPWIFDIGAEFGSWRERPDDARRIEARLADSMNPAPEQIFSDILEQHSRRQSVERFSIEPLVARLDGWVNEVARTTYIAVPGETSATLLLADGSFRPPPDQTVVRPEAVRALAVRQFATNTDRHRYGTYPNMDQNLWRYFEAWVRENARDGGAVWLVLSPYHPEIYGRITALPENRLREIEARTREMFVGVPGVNVIGSYDPEVAGVEAADFYDGDHLLDSGLRKLLAPLVGP